VARDIWLAPQNLGQVRVSAVDYAALFKRDAPWKVAAAHTRVFKFYSGYLLHAPQAEIDAAGRPEPARDRHRPGGRGDERRAQPAIGTRRPRQC
jgi:hypothetical protein